MGLGGVVLGTVISGFFSVPGGPPTTNLSRENRKSLRSYLSITLRMLIFLNTLILSLAPYETVANSPSWLSGDCVRHRVERSLSTDKVLRKIKHSPLID